jgi:hypothetical protein
MSSSKNLTGSARVAAAWAKELSQFAARENGARATQHAAPPTPSPAQTSRGLFGRARVAAAWAQDLSQLGTRTSVLSSTSTPAAAAPSNVVAFPSASSALPIGGGHLAGSIGVKLSGIKGCVVTPDAASKIRERLAIGTIDACIQAHRMISLLPHDFREAAALVHELFDALARLPTSPENPLRARATALDEDDNDAPLDEDGAA